MLDVTKGGKPLPPSRAAAVEQAAAYYQEMAQERDDLNRQAAMLRSEVSAHKVVTEAQASQLAEMESRCAAYRLERDQAMADRAKFETLLIGIQAQLKAFAIPSAPLVRSAEQEAEDDAQRLV